MFRHKRRQPVNVHCVFLINQHVHSIEREGDGGEREEKAYRRHLVGTTQNKLQLLNGHIYSPHQSRDAVAVVLGPIFNQLNGGLEVIQEGVNIGQEDLDVASCLQELGDFHNLLSLDMLNVAWIG